MTKIHSILLLLIVSFQLLNAASDVLYSHAKNGLIIREKPNIESKNIGKIPFGKKIKILKKSDAIETIENLQGNWCFVQYKEQKGWVFNGYLSYFDPTLIFINDFTIKNLSFKSSKKQIINAYGSKVKIDEPNYECGFLSSDWQKKSFYQLLYEDIVFIGNEEDGYIIEKIVFNSKSSHKLIYKNQIIDYKTTFQDLQNIFGQNQMRKLNNNSDNHDQYIIPSGFSKNASEDAYIIYLNKGKVMKIEYWSPC